MGGSLHLLGEVRERESDLPPATRRNGSAHSFPGEKGGERGLAERPGANTQEVWCLASTRKPFGLNFFRRLDEKGRRIQQAEIMLHEIYIKSGKLDGSTLSWVFSVPGVRPD